MRTLFFKSLEYANEKAIFPKVNKDNILIRKNIDQGGLCVFNLSPNRNIEVRINGGMFVNEDLSETDVLNLIDGVPKKIKVRLDDDYAFMYLEPGTKVIFKYITSELDFFKSPYIDFSFGFPKIWSFELAFLDHTYFNESLNSLDFSECESLKYAFSGCSRFDKDISEIDVSRITNMIGTFNNCYSFNKDISKWNFNVNVDLDEFLNYSGMDANNYSKFLIKLDNTDFSARTTRKVLGALNVKYNYLGEGARSSLINKGWTISDGGKIN